MLRNFIYIKNNFLSDEESDNLITFFKKIPNKEFYKVGKKVGRNEYISDHFRRFIVPKEIKKTLSKKFDIVFAKQSTQFAKYKNFKPKVLRIIAKKKL